MNSPRRVVLLGSTGSIGTQTADVVRRNPGRFALVALSAGGSQPQLLARQASDFGVSTIGVPSDEAARALHEQLRAVGRSDVHLVVGPDASDRLAALDADVVLNAVAGAQGLRATIAALDAGRTVALANKESLIAGGSLVIDRARPGQLIPVDSEHSAIAQCLRGGTADEVRKLVITASGGPFRGRSRAEMADVTPVQALAHPTWNMGQLITTNSATLINKGLEMIEAHLLFGVAYDQIEVVVHPQSIVHSMVEFNDGATLAQASPPDMRLPIALALGWPDRVPDAVRPLDLTAAQTWQFDPLDVTAFPSVELAREAGRAGGLAPAVYNAANEAMVEQFHAGRIGFLDIVDTVGTILREWLSNRPLAADKAGTVEDVEAADDWARDRARTVVGIPTR